MTFISCKMHTHIIAAGWNPWDSGNTDPGATTRYSEYGNTNIGGNTPLTSPVASLGRTR